MTSAYKTGQITLTNGSASVVGVLTAWQTSLIAGGVIYPEADGNPLPIQSVDGDLAITAETKWKGATGTYNYALVRDTAYLQQVSTNSSTLAQLIAELAAGTVFKYDASGDLAGRATYNDRPKGFAYLVSIGVTDPQLYVKGSATSGDWDGPFDYGKGDMGPPTSLTFGATVTEPSTSPASAVVTGSGPYNVVFHIPRGADGDITWQFAWATAKAYSVNQAVTNGGSSYVCKLSHTSAAANAPGTGASWATYWDVLASKGDTGQTGPAGAMDPSVYDPQAKHADAFARTNHTGTQSSSTIISAYAVKTGNYAATAADNGALHLFSAAATVTLANATALGAGWTYEIIAAGGDVVIDPAGSQTIDGQATYTVRKGSSAKIVSEGGSTLQLVTSSLRNQLALISSGTGSAVASFDVPLPADYDFFELIAQWQPSASGNIPFLRISDDNGATYETTNYNYSTSQAVNNAVAAVSGANASAISFTGTQNNAPALARILMLNAGSLPEFVFDAHYPSSAGAFRASGGGYYGILGKVTNLRLLMSAGTMTGSYKLFGMKI